MKKVVIYLIFVCFLFPFITNGQDGSIDVTFNGSGYSLVNISSYDYTRNIAVDPNGKAVLIGDYNTEKDIYVLKYNADGTLDNTFSGDGKFTYSFGTSTEYGRGVAIQPDGKIVATGYYSDGVNNNVFVMRLNTDGTLDNTFNSSGVYTFNVGAGSSYGYDVYIDTISTMDKILISGWGNVSGVNSYFVTRLYMLNGALDATFDGDGTATVAIDGGTNICYHVSMLSTGKIILGGTVGSGNSRDIGLACLNSDGSLYTGFNTTGTLRFSISNGDEAYGMTITSDDKIVLAGSTYYGYNYMIAARVNPNGTLDNTFSGDGLYMATATNEFIRDVAVQPDGKILFGGNAGTNPSDFIIMRFNSNGTVDNSFGTSGKATHHVGSGDYAIAMALRNWKIYLAGASYSSDYNSYVGRFKACIPPTISSQPTDAAVCEGSYANFMTMTSGSSPISYQWYNSASAPVGINSFALEFTSASLSNSDTYYCVATNVCGSTNTNNVTLTVNPNPNANAGQDVTVCDGEQVILSATGGDTYTWNNGVQQDVAFTPTTTLTYTVTVTNSVTGCSSTDNAIVTVNQLPSITSYTEASICDNGSATLSALASSGVVNWYSALVGGTLLSSGNDYSTPTISTTTTYYAEALDNGCASASKTAVTATVNYSTAGSETITACDTYTWPANNSTYTASGVYSTILVNSVGCDSLVTLNLNIKNSTSGDTTAVACDSFVWYGTTYNTSGTPAHTLTNSVGCDSVVTLHLTINYSNTGDTTAIACDSFSWYGTTYTTSATPTHTFTNINGCDSVVTLHLAINYSNAGSETVTACDSYSWSANGTTYTTSGVYTSTLTNINGCDSIATLNLTINNSNTGSETITACDSYLWPASGMTYSNSGTYNTTLTNIMGCDSIVTLSLTVNYSDASDTFAIACNSFDWYGTTYTSTGSATHTFTNEAGCDSIVTLNLTINYSNSGSEDITVCDTYTWSADGNIYTSTGVYTTTLTNIDGCDSIATLNLTVNYSNSGSEDVTACDSYLWSANGTTYNNSGVYSATLTNVNGCDSIATLNLTVNYSNTGDTSAVSCDSFDWYGNTYTSSGSYTHTLTNSAGCDSVVTLHLIINYSESSSETITACDSYTWPITWMTYTASGSYPAVFTNQLGCDSIIYLNLTIKHGSDTNITEISCGNYSLNGTVYNTSGTYTQFLQNSEGCDSIITLNLTVNPEAILNLSAPVSICQGTSTILNAGNFATYLWSNGATSASITVSSGTYSVTVTNSYGCSDNGSVSIGQYPAVSLSSFVNNTNPLYNSGSINLTVLSGTAPFSYNWSNGMHTEDISGLSAGTYTVTVTSADGCKKTQSFTVSTQGCTLFASINSTTINCYGANTASATAMATGGTIPYTYLWSNGATTETINNIGAGVYYVTVTGAGGCVSTAATNISQPQSIAISKTVTDASCGNPDGEIVLTVSGGVSPYTYLWSTGATSSSINSLPSASYSVTVTDANNCNKTTTVLINNNGSPTVILNKTDISCNGASDGQISTSVSGGITPYSYNWSNSETTASLTNLAPGLYTLTLADVNNCVAVKEIEIIEPEQISIQYTTVDELFGNDGSIQLNVSGGTAPFTYLWDDSSTLSGLDNIPAGDYSVTVTDVNSCESIITITVGGSPCALGVSNSISDATCFNASNAYVDITVTNGMLPYTFIWSNGKTTEDIFNIKAGTYSLTITDSRGCITNTSVIVSQPAELVVNITTTSANCNQSDGEAVANISGGTSPYSYQWSTGDVTNTISNVNAGYYMVTVNDMNSCSKFAVAMISNSNSLNLTVNSVTNTSCSNGNDGAIDISVSGGASPYTFSWSNGAITEDISGLSAGPYEIIVNDNIGCISALSIDVLNPDDIIVETSSTPANCGNSDGTATAVATGGTTPYSYLWSNFETTQTIINMPVGSYSVKVTDAKGCFKIASTAISNDNGPIISNSAVSEAGCSSTDGSVDITISGGSMPFTFNWSDNSINEDLDSVSAGDYSVTITDDNNCVTVGNFIVTPQVPLLNPICVVLVDSTTNRNKLVWEKVQTTGIDHYNIYKESTMSGIYQLIESIPYSNLSEYIDLSANPAIRSWRYKLSAVDVCGNESPLSDYHKTMHLTMNEGLNNTINLIWDHYEGFTFYSYEIYRHTDVNGWEQIQIIPNNLTSFTDYPPTQQVLSYKVVVDKGDSCWSSSIDKSTAGPYSQSISNIDDYAIWTSIDKVNDNFEFSIYPNPVKNQLTVEIPSSKSKIQNSRLEISDIFGQVISTTNINKNHTIDTSNLVSGIYLIRLHSNNKTYIKKFIKE